MTESTKKSGRKRVLLAGGTLLGIGAIAVAASFTDFANVNLGNGFGSGIGDEYNNFDIQVVGTTQFGEPVPGTWQDANTPEGVNIAVLGAQGITPGDTTSVDIPVRNASNYHPAVLSLSLADNPKLVGDSDYAEALRYSVSVDDKVIVKDAKQEDVKNLNLRTIAQTATTSINVAVTLPDQGSAAANNALQMKQHYVQVQIHAESLKQL